MTKLVKQQQDEEGNWYAVLQETAFYPTGGGQPHDKGVLNGVQVQNVMEVDGEIRHYIERKLDNEQVIEGEIDWERRFDHMQQHLGQHILTAAFVQVANVETVSFHLGKETCTIDLNTTELSHDRIQEAEELANRMILENHPVMTKWVTKEEANQYPLRKKLSVDDKIRLVIIPNYDYNGCGGTHPKTTGEVGGMKILGWEREKKKLRLEFICGKRIFKQFSKKHEIIVNLSQLLSVKQNDIVDAVLQLQNTNKNLGKEINHLEQLILEYEANHLLELGGKVIHKVYQNKKMQDLQKLMRILLEKNPTLQIILVNEGENRLEFVCATSKDGSINLKEIASDILPLINGKGGGSPHTIQGGGEKTMSGEKLLEKIIERFQLVING